MIFSKLAVLPVLLALGLAPQAPEHTVQIRSKQDKSKEASKAYNKPDNYQWILEDPSTYRPQYLLDDMVDNHRLTVSFPKAISKDNDETVITYDTTWKCGIQSANETVATIVCFNSTRIDKYIR